MTVLSDGGFCVSYYDSKTRATYLTTGDGTQKKLAKGCEIKGDGQHLAARDGKIIFFDTDAVYEFEVETKVVREKLRLEGRNLDTNNIGDIRIGAEEISLVSYGAAANAIKYTIFSPGDVATESEEEKFDQYGRRYIYIYDYSSQNQDLVTLKKIIDSFNEQSEAYQVVLKDFGFKKSYEDEFDPLKVIAANEFPDLIFSNQNSLINTLEQKGCFEDLIPYLEKSEKLSLSDIAEPVLKVYTEEGKLYGLPRIFELETIMGKKAQMGEPGWNFDEFFDWLEAHPDVKAHINLTRDGIYEMGIDSILDACVDEETGEADFLGETFRNFAVRLKELNRSNELVKPGPELNNIRPEDWYISHTNIRNLCRAAWGDLECGEETVFKGFPTVDGSRAVYFQAVALSIFSTGEVKDGAYEFLEYYLLYQGVDELELYGIVSKEATSEIFTVKSRLEKGIEKVLKGETLYGEPYQVSREQIDRIIDLFPDVTVRKESNREIRNIVDEELAPFWEGQKDIDSVCKIIQSRVEVYLSEH